MPYLSATHASCYGSVVGSGHCVDLLRQCAGLPHTSHWRRGVLARESYCPSGTIIATFDPDGRYGNHTDGRSHAAILLADTTEGFMVCDQWQGREVGERLIRYKGGAGDPVNDADAYHCVELVEE